VTRIAIGRGSLVYGEELDPGRCLSVGDTPLDVQAAHAARVACVGVASHRYTTEQLTEAGADWVVDSLARGEPMIYPS
jgi:phosphoglycolate phosphatase